ncbi:MAG TPA: ABC transporter ATP-binding protein [Terriglobia bacterium]|nr:ABC transporter ATP-binding protein [Terriglobia bacterium]
MAETFHEEEVLGKAYDSRLMRRLLTYLRPYRRVVVLALIAIFFYGLLQAVPPYLMKVEVDRYLDPTHQGHLPAFLASFLSPNPVAGIFQIAFALFLPSVLLTFVLEFGQDFAMQFVGQKVMYDLRKQIFAHLQRLELSFYDRNPVGRLVTRVTTDVDVMNDLFASGVVAIFGDVFTLLSIVAIMLRVNWELALMTFSVLPAIAVVTMWFRKAVRESYRRIRLAIARINAYLQEHLTGMAVLQLFNREQRSYQEFESINRVHMRAYKDSILAYGLFYPTVEFLGVMAVAIILYDGGLRSLHGAVTVGTAIAFIQYSQRFFRPIQDMSDKYNILQAAMASAERIFKLLDAPVTIADPERPLALPVHEAPASGVTVSGDRHAEGDGHSSSDGPAQGNGNLAAAGARIEFCSVGFAYDGEHRVVEDVSFTIEPGERVAVVGHTGAGKTTLTSLLLRYYEVQEGAIRLDGIDIRQLRLSDLRRNFGLVLQDSFLFSGTIASNVRLGRVPGMAPISDDEVREAARQVNALGFIENLPGAFDEPVKERGVTLSVGQKQLLCFARALAYKPRVLILDEATSSIDPQTEYLIREALGRMLENRTALVIAHRLSTIQNASKIVVMHKGRVREIGTHQELIDRRGLYFKLYQLQYKDQEIRPGAGTQGPGEPNREWGAEGGQ